jgi:hypothetical protein
MSGRCLLQCLRRRAAFSGQLPRWLFGLQVAECWHEKGHPNMSTSLPNMSTSLQHGLVQWIFVVAIL